MPPSRLNYTTLDVDGMYSACIVDFNEPLENLLNEEDIPHFNKVWGSHSILLVTGGRYCLHDAIPNICSALSNYFSDPNISCGRPLPKCVDGYDSMLQNNSSSLLSPASSREADLENQLMQAKRKEAELNKLIQELEENVKSLKNDNDCISSNCSIKNNNGDDRVNLDSNSNSRNCLSLYETIRQLEEDKSQLEEQLKSANVKLFFLELEKSSAASATDKYGNNNLESGMDLIGQLEVAQDTTRSLEQRCSQLEKELAEVQSECDRRLHEMNEELTMLRFTRRQVYPDDTHESTDCSRTEESEHSECGRTEGSEHTEGRTEGSEGSDSLTSEELEDKHQICVHTDLSRSSHSALRSRTRESAGEAPGDCRESRKLAEEDSDSELWAQRLRTLELQIESLSSKSFVRCLLYAGILTLDRWHCFVYVHSEERDEWRARAEQIPPEPKPLVCETEAAGGGYPSYTELELTMSSLLEKYEKLKGRVEVRLS